MRWERREDYGRKKGGREEGKEKGKETEGREK